MIRLNLTIGLWFAVCSIVLAQRPVLNWQKRLGGDGDDVAFALAVTADHGFVVAGVTRSNRSGVANSHSDTWVIRLDSLGDLRWQRTLGGSQTDVATALTVTTDGGFVVAGYTASTNGDVTGNHGGYDVWVLKLNGDGTLLWQKTLGGSRHDFAYAITATTDGGYVIAGETESTNGDVHSQRGAGDVWVIKLAGDGTLVWQKTYGGSNPDRAHALACTDDGGFILAGTTESGDGDVSGSYEFGLTDVWVLRLNPEGTLLWQTTLGGSGLDYAEAITPTADSGFVLAGGTNSRDGDVTGLHGYYFDVWVVKLNQHGGRVWQQTFGGSGSDVACSLLATPDGDVVVAGYTESDDGDITDFAGYNDVWLLKLTGAGRLLWQKTLGGSGAELAHAIAVLPDGQYALAGYSTSGTGPEVGTTRNSNVWIATVQKPFAPLELLPPTYNCTTNELTLATAGGNGNSIEFAVISPNQGWCRQSRFLLDTGQRRKPVLMQARQRNTAGDDWIVVELSFDPQTYCVRRRL